MASKLLARFSEVKRTFFPEWNEFLKRKSIPEKRKLIPRDVAKTLAALG
jgi:hypothetical protein